MYILQEENKDLREDLQRTKAISYDTKIKEMTEENQNLRRRNGQLLIEKEEVERKMKAIQDQMKKFTMPVQPQMMDQQAHLANSGLGMMRPQTAAGALGGKKEMLLDDEDLLNAQTAFDRELNELLAKN